MRHYDENRGWIERMPRSRRRGEYEDYGWESGQSVLPQFRDPSLQERFRRSSQRRPGGERPYSGDIDREVDRLGESPYSYDRNFGEEYLRDKRGSWSGRRTSWEGDFDEATRRGYEYDSDLGYYGRLAGRGGYGRDEEYGRDRPRDWGRAGYYGGLPVRDYGRPEGSYDEPRRRTYEEDYGNRPLRRGYESDEFGWEGYYGEPTRPNYYRDYDPQADWRAPGPYTGRGPRGYQRSYERVREEICERLTHHGEIDASDIDLDVTNGEVTLRGMVDSRRTKRMVEDVVESVPEVRDIHNELRVRDASRQGRSGERDAEDQYQVSNAAGFGSDPRVGVGEIGAERRPATDPQGGLRTGRPGQAASDRSTQRQTIPSRPSTPEEKRESGQPGGGQGRVDEVGHTGVYPASGPLPPGKAEVRDMASWGQGERGAEGYQDSGRSEIWYSDPELKKIKEDDEDEAEEK